MVALVIVMGLLGAPPTAARDCSDDAVEQVAAQLSAAAPTSVRLASGAMISPKSSAEAITNIALTGGGVLSLLPAGKRGAPLAPGQIFLAARPALGRAVFALGVDKSGVVVDVGRVRRALPQGAFEVAFAAPVRPQTLIVDGCGRLVGVANRGKGARVQVQSASQMVSAAFRSAPVFKKHAALAFGLEPGSGRIVVTAAAPKSALVAGDVLVDIALLPARDAIAAWRAVQSQPPEKSMLLKVSRAGKERVVFLAPASTEQP